MRKISPEKRKKFEILEHTADLKLKVFGSSAKNLFSNSLYAMAYLQKPDIIEESTFKKIIRKIRGHRITENIKIESIDYTTLLIGFLNEILAISDTHNAVFFDIKFEEFSETKIEGKIYGIKVDSFDKDIKAVTYHEVEVKEIEPGKWESTLVFDI